MIEESPFPGMDPYLESRWGDVHASLIIYCRDALTERLPADLIARVEERVVMEASDSYHRSIYPDVRILDRGAGESAGLDAGGVACAEAVEVALEPEPFTETFIEIRDVQSGHRVITVIEILSPSNKMPGPGQNKYLQKQRELVQSGVSLVEIDLLRGGDHVVSVPIQALSPKLSQAPYKVSIRRAWTPSRGQYYSILLQNILPTILVPLRESDGPLPLDVQALLRECYRKGRYASDIDYSRKLEPPVSQADQLWIDKLLKEKGRR